MPNRPRIPAEIEREILLESGHRCAVCGTPCPLEQAHIIPWHKSREHKAEDLICLCANCHARADKEKWGEKTLREYKRRPWVLRQHQNAGGIPEPTTGLQIKPTRMTISPGWMEVNLPRWTNIDVPLVGRSAELNRLRDIWDELQTGSARAVFVIGEAGVGKTRLAHTFLAQLASSGVHWLASRAFEGDQNIPYSALAEMLRPTVEWGIIPDVLDEALAEVARLLPGLAVHRPNLPSVLEIEPKQAEVRRRWALATFIVGLSTQSPLILYLDDLQWTDRATLECVKYVLTRNPYAPLLLIGCLRSEDARKEEYMRGLRADLRRTDLLTEISLPPLSEEETYQFICAMSGMTKAPIFSQRLHLHTEGNPFFTLETIRALFGTGVLFFDEDGQWATEFDEETESYAELPIPESVSDVIRLRLVGLDRPVRKFLDAAAVFGREFDPSFVRQVSELDGDQTTLVLNELLARQLIRADGYFFDFSHGMIRETIYQDLNLWQRRRLHGRIAKTLERAVDQAPSLRDIQRLAHHFYEGGLWVPALVYQVEAGQRALGLFETQTARHYLERAKAISETKIALGEPQPAPNAVKLRQVLVARCDLEDLRTFCVDLGVDYDDLCAEGKTGKARELIAYLERNGRILELVKVGRRLRPDIPWNDVRYPSLEQLPLVYLEGLGDVYRYLGLFEEALNHYRLGLDVVRDDVNETATLCWKIAVVLERQSHYDQAVQWLDRGLDAVGTSKDRAISSKIYMQYGLISQRRGDLDTAFEWATKALTVESAQAHNLLALICRDQGNREKALLHLHKSIGISEAVKDLINLATAYNGLGIILFEMDRWEEAKHNYEQALELQSSVGDAYGHALTLCNLSDLYRQLGCPDEAIAHAEAGLEKYLQLESMDGQAFAHLNLGAALLEAGKPNQARINHLEVARRLLVEYDVKDILPDVEQSIAQALLQEGLLDEAENAAQRALQVAADQGSCLDSGIAQRVLGCVYQAQGRLTEAEKALKRSVDILSCHGSRYELGRIYLALATVYSEARNAQAKAWQSQACSVFRALGAEMDLKKAKALELDE